MKEPIFNHFQLTAMAIYMVKRVSMQSNYATHAHCLLPLFFFLLLLLQDKMDEPLRVCRFSFPPSHSRELS